MKKPKSTVKPRSRTAARARPTSKRRDQTAPPPGRTEVRGTTWKKSTTIAAEKFETVSAAILKVLPTEPIRFTALTTLVAAELPGFSGSVAWYAITCARELERRGLVRRTTKPVLYGRPLPGKAPSGARAGSRRSPRA